MDDTSETEGANDSNVRFGDLLRAIETLHSDDPETFAELVRLLSTAAGQAVLEAEARVTARLEALQPQADTAAARVWEGERHTAFLCSDRVREPLHAADIAGLTSIDPWAAPDGHPDQEDRRPTFKALHWWACGDDAAELTPPCVVREMFLLVIDGVLDLEIEGAAPRRIEAGAEMVCVWLGGVLDEPWLPRVAVRAEGEGARGILFLSSEVGVPMVEDPGCHGAAVRLVPAAHRDQAGAFWKNLARHGIAGPLILSIPRGMAAQTWARDLPSLPKAELDNYPHNGSVNDGLFIPRVDKAWRDLNAQLAGKPWPRLLYRVIELPPREAEGRLQLDTHNGMEAITLVHGACTALMDLTSSADEAQHVQLQELWTRGSDPERVEPAARPDGSFDILLLQSDGIRHNVIAEGGPAIALVFATTKLSWARRWRELSDARVLEAARRKREALRA